MKANIMGIDDLFDRDVSYRIPVFQRPYAWGKDEWGALWDDVQKVAEDLLRAPSASDVHLHFMGAIVVQPRESDAPLSELQPILIVDGQQRLTTLQLFIKVLDGAFTATLVDTSDFASLREYLFNRDSLTGGDHLNATKMRQSNRLDQADFQDIINGRLNSNRPSRPIVDAYLHLREWVTNWLNADPVHVDARAHALYDVAKKYLKVATIELDKGDQPHFTFEILNSRGEPLKQADYIKNTVMYEADLIDDETKAQTLWGMFEDDWWRQEESRGRVLQIQLDRFLNYWCIMRLRDNVQMQRTAAAFRRYVGEPERKIEAVAEDVRDVGVVYKNIEENRQPGIEEILKRLKVLEISVVMPPLLWLYTQDINDQERQSAVRALESFLVRRILCNLGTQGLNALFIELVGHLGQHTDEPANQVIIDYLIGQKAENRIWPDDKQVIDYLSIRPMPGNAARRKMIFETIELSKRPPMTEHLTVPTKLTVEHLMPQGWTSEGWPFSETDMDEAQARQLRGEHIGLIGNLTLATRELNSSMSNRSWENKRRALEGFSTLMLNKEVLDSASDGWDETAIKQRSEALAETIAKVWPRPSSLNGPAK